MQHRNLSGRGGFTLAEMLVAMALLAVLAAVVLPSVLGQLNKGEVSRVSSDLKGVSQAIKTFYSDMQRWPASLQQLAVAPTSAATDLSGNAYGNLSSRWKGPYLERLDVSSGIETGFEAIIGNTLARTPWTASGSDHFLVINVTGIAQSDANKIDELIDGSTSGGTGQVRYTSSTQTLQFFANPAVTP